MIKFFLSGYFYLPIIYIVSGIILYFIIVFLINKSSIYRSKKSSKKKETIISLINNVIKYVITIIVILMILDVYHVDTSTILASLGIVGVIVGLAFQDILKNLLSSINIIFDNRYAIGDNVLINGFRGDVVSLGLQTTKIKAFSGEILIINNSSINEIINYSVNDSALVVDINVSYESDLKLVDKALEVIKEKVSALDDVIGEVNILGIEELGNSSIVYRLSTLCKSMTHFGVRREILRIVKDEFDSKKINIPYNKLEVYLNK